jgi:uncharacterized membrane protein
VKTDRLNALTDGVIAIVLTIMVLELKFPAESSLAAVREILPPLGLYLLSFVNIGIFWNNLHQLTQSARKVNGAALWANLSLLFWLTLVPLAIRWIGETGFTPWPIAFYGALMMCSAISYLLLERALIAADDETSVVKKALGSKFKEWLSVALYASAVALAFVSPLLAVAVYIGIAILWLVPDRRFERRL